MFVFDQAAATTRLVGSTVDGTVTTTTGNMGTVGAESPVISANGQFIAYFDNSTNLVTGQMDTDNVEDFVFGQGRGDQQPGYSRGQLRRPGRQRL